MLWNGDHWLHAMVRVILTAWQHCVQSCLDFGNGIILTAELAQWFCGALFPKSQLQYIVLQDLWAC